MKYFITLISLIFICSLTLNAKSYKPIVYAKPDAKVSEPVMDLFGNQPTGITIPIFSKYSTFVAEGQAEEYYPVKEATAIQKGEKIEAETWRLADSVEIDGYMPAGSNFGVMLNRHTCKFDIIRPFELTNEGKAAVAKAPKWLRSDLEYTLSKLTDSVQKKFAAVINTAEDPYIDEIAFSIARSTPQYLASKFSNPQLFVENAKLMYQYDKDLKYVEIVDHGTSSTDENYYSTVKYWRIDSDSMKQQIEVPMSIYYNYIVHPKTSDEIQAYVDSSKYEHSSDMADHSLNITQPPKGSFWRDFLYRHTEKNLDTTKDMYPILKDSIALADVVWDETNANSYCAIKVLTRWINDVMDFTSKDERPHQPIRIYKLHIGRCGEHEDITNAASRTCLIPCRGIEAYSSDHVWNEFWDKQWRQWEPVNNSYDNKMCYSKGWGKKFGSLMIHESTGEFTPVTDDYTTHTAKITIFVVDKNSKPVDGARVLLAVQGTMDSASIFIDTYGITDNDGKYVFSVESGHNYFARVDCNLGRNPTATNSVIPLGNTPPDSGASYSYKIPLTGSIPANKFVNKDTIIDTTKYYKISVDYLTNKVTNWQIGFDDLANSYIALAADSGKVNFFVIDDVNYNKLVAKQSFDSYSTIEKSYSGNQTFYAPDQKNWFALFNTGFLTSNIVSVKAKFKLYANSTLDVKQSDKLANQLLMNYPNPVIDMTVIPFTLQNTSRVTLNIFTPEGTLVKRLVDNTFELGEYSFVWDTKDENNNIVTPGIYIYRLNTGNESFTGKMIVIGK